MQLHKNAKVELLKGVPLFAGCSKADLQRIASLADELDLGEGATLIREGERGREFIVVVDGTVQVTRKGRSYATSARATSSARSRSSPTSRARRRSPPPRPSPPRRDRPGFKSLLDRTPAMATKVLAEPRRAAPLRRAVGAGTAGVRPKSEHRGATAPPVSDFDLL